MRDTAAAELGGLKWKRSRSAHVACIFSLHGLDRPLPRRLPSKQLFPVGSGPWASVYEAIPQHKPRPGS